MFANIDKIRIDYYGDKYGFYNEFNSPKYCLLSIQSPTYSNKNDVIKQISFYDKNNYYLGDFTKRTHKDLIDYLQKNIFLDKNKKELQIGDKVITSTGKQGIIKKMGVGTSKKSLSVFVANQSYPCIILPKNVEKVAENKPETFKEDSCITAVSVKDAPYFIELKIGSNVYNYACFDNDVKVGDYVIVSGTASHLIHKVKKVTKNNDFKNKDIVKEEVKCICTFDTSAYEERVKIREIEQFKKDCNDFLKNVDTQEKIDVLQQLISDKILKFTEEK